MHAAVFTVVCIAAGTAQAEEGWTYYGGSGAGTNYSPLARIDRGNVGRLEVAWIYRTGEIERRGAALAGKQSFENQPILFEGSLIVCTPLGRLVALDPQSGAERWVFDPNPPAPQGVILPKCRGVTAWTDPRASEGETCARRVFYGKWDFKVHPAGRARISAAAVRWCSIPVSRSRLRVRCR